MRIGKHYLITNFSMLAGIKVSQSGDIFVSVPRWKNKNGGAYSRKISKSPLIGVPATISKLVNVDGQTLLQPYPSWEMNQVKLNNQSHLQIGDPNAIQSVLGFEIDSKNVLWVLDQGKVGGEAAIPGLNSNSLSNLKGSIKLLLFDLNSDTLLQKYVFSEEEAPANNSFLNDIVVDSPNNFAYITGYSEILSD